MKFTTAAVLAFTLVPSPVASKLSAKKRAKRFRGVQSKEASEGRGLKAAPKKGKTPKEKGAPKISNDFIPIRGAITGSQTGIGVSVFKKGIFEVKAVCEPADVDEDGFVQSSTLTLNLIVTNESPVKIACFGETTDGTAEFVVSSLSPIEETELVFIDGTDNAVGGGGFFCSDGSYIGYDGEALVSATDDLVTSTDENEKLLFGPGADCIFAGTINYQEAK